MSADCSGMSGSVWGLVLEALSFVCFIRLGSFGLKAVP